MAHPAKDAEVKVIEFKGHNLQVKEKFPLFKFMKVLNKSPIEALELLFTPESLETLEEIDMDFADLEALLDQISSALGAKNAKN